MNFHIIYMKNIFILAGFWGFGVTVKAILAKIVEMVTEVEKIEISKNHPKAPTKPLEAVFGLL